jgi:hypothetical protein
VPWEAPDFDDFGPIPSALAGRAWLDRLDRHFWLEIWRAPVIEAVEEMGIEARMYGPVLALVATDLAQTPLLNMILGGGEGGAVADGHLEEAVEWVESLGVDCRIPISPQAPEAGAAEDLLNRWGCRRSGSLVRFTRGAGLPGFEPPPWLEVRELTECAEGFGHLIGEGMELQLMAQTFFDSLPGRPDWRSYLAIDEQGRPIAAATMMCHYEFAQLGFVGTGARDRGRGAHLALLHRRILDAAGARCHTLFADTEESLDDLDGPSPAARNLVRAGFGQVSVRPVWRLPEAVA